MTSRILTSNPYRIIDLGYSTPCWLWQRSLTSNGYARTFNGRVHIIYWERLNGPIPDGKELDHLCRERSCVNPAHLEAVTHRVNVKRGMAGYHRKGIKVTKIRG